MSKPSDKTTPVVESVTHRQVAEAIVKNLLAMMPDHRFAPRIWGEASGDHLRIHLKPATPGEPTTEHRMPTTLTHYLLPFGRSHGLSRRAYETACGHFVEPPQHSVTPSCATCAGYLARTDEEAKRLRDQWDHEDAERN